MFDFSNYLAKSKYFDDSNKLVIVKMKHETNGVAIKEFVGLKVKMYSFLVDDVFLSLNKKVDCAYSPDNYKSLKISIAAIMLRFVFDHLKTKNMCKNAVKNCCS